MKYGVIGDIHGNLYALKAIITDLKKQGITKYFIAGDLIADCNYPNEVLDYIQTLDAVVIKGNREEYVLNYLDGLCPEWETLKQMSSVVWTALQLTEENISYVRRLPMMSQIEVNETLITLVHGSPFDLNEHLYPDQQQARLLEAIQSVQSDILICAHSHRQWQKRVNETLVLNPGAAGVHFNAESGAEYAILQWTPEGWQVTHELALYDIKAFKEDMFNSSLHELAPTWAKLIVQSIEEGFNANITFLRKIFKEYEIQGYISNEIWDKVSFDWHKEER